MDQWMDVCTKHQGPHFEELLSLHIKEIKYPTNPEDNFHLTSLFFIFRENTAGYFSLLRFFSDLY